MRNQFCFMSDECFLFAETKTRCIFLQTFNPTVVSKLLKGSYILWRDVNDKVNFDIITIKFAI